MSGPIPAPPSIGTANGARIVVAGTPAAGQVMVADGPNAAHWGPAGGGAGGPVWVGALWVTAAGAPFDTWDTNAIQTRTGDSSLDLAAGPDGVVERGYVAVGKTPYQSRNGLFNFEFFYAMTFAVDPGPVRAHLFCGKTLKQLAPAVSSGGLWLVEGSLSSQQYIGDYQDASVSAWMTWENGAPTGRQDLIITKLFEDSIRLQN